MDADLVIIRGLPGSGKTTLAREVAARCGFLHFEVDMWFETEDGYLYDESQMSDAKKWCFKSARDALIAGRKVVVTNVFTKIEQMSEYLDLAKSVAVIECTAQYGSAHDIPDTVIKKMRESWEPYESAIRL